MSLRKISVVLSVVAALVAVPAMAEQVDLSNVSSTGSPEPIRTGFFAETALGTFMTIGGADGYSNMEAFLSLGVGYDIMQAFSVGLQFQLAPNAGDCYGPPGPSGNIDAYCSGANPQGSSTFTMAALDLVASYKLEILERLFIPIRVFGGMADFSPLPRSDMGAAPGADDVWVPTGGLATGLEYATRFDHFTIGLEVSGRFVPSTVNLFALSIYPRVKYTF
ncbi:MAG: adventurous gliding motility protein CglE [Deltaproteobacteria bacterium]